MKQEKKVKFVKLRNKKGVIMKIEIMKKLDEICTTEQQDIALKKYLKQCFEFDMEISEENFRYYYSCYCYENNYFNDLK